MKWIYVVQLAFFISLNGVAQTAMTVTGNWTASITSRPTEAGSNYSTTAIESLNNQTLIDLTPGLLLTTYRVSIQKVNTSWPAGVNLNVRRTSPGSGLNLGATSGGDAYFTVTTSPQLFFTYSSLLNLSKVSGIAIQYSLTGLSVLVPVANYSTTLLYTVTSP